MKTAHSHQSTQGATKPTNTEHNQDKRYYSPNINHDQLKTTPKLIPLPSGPRPQQTIHLRRRTTHALNTHKITIDRTPHKSEDPKD